MSVILINRNDPYYRPISFSVSKVSDNFVLDIYGPTGAMVMSEIFSSEDKLYRYLEQIFG